MELIEKNPTQITFKAEIEDSLANAVRRYLNQVPIVAIDEVEIYKENPDPGSRVANINLSSFLLIFSCFVLKVAYLYYNSNLNGILWKQEKFI